MHLRKVQGVGAKRPAISDKDNDNDNDNDNDSDITAFDGKRHVIETFCY